MRGDLIAVAVLMSTGCSAGVSASAESGGYVSSDGLIMVVPVADREPAPDISGATLAGTEVALDEFTGKIVVVNTWGSWCGECIAEADDLVAVDNAFGEDVQFLGINVRDNEAAARSYEVTYGIEYPSIFDPSSSQLLGFRPELAAIGFPVTYVIDTEGRVAARILSNTTASTLSGVIADVQEPDQGG